MLTHLKTNVMWPFKYTGHAHADVNRKQRLRQKKSLFLPVQTKTQSWSFQTKMGPDTFPYFSVLAALKHGTSNVGTRPINRTRPAGSKSLAPAEIWLAPEVSLSYLPLINDTNSHMTIYQELLFPKLFWNTQWQSMNIEQGSTSMCTWHIVVVPPPSVNCGPLSWPHDVENPLIRHWSKTKSMCSKWECSIFLNNNTDYVTLDKPWHASTTRKKNRNRKSCKVTPTCVIAGTWSITRHYFWSISFRYPHTLVFNRWNGSMTHDRTCYPPVVCTGQPPPLGKHTAAG